MFERKEPFQWKIPILILTGILVLSGGIYIGVKTRKVVEKPAFNNETINEENEETKELLKSNVDFTALYAISDLTAFGAYKAIMEEGKTIPGDYSVLGFDGLDMSRYFQPSLSTMKQPCEQMVKSSIKLLMDAINGNDEKKQLIFEAELLEKESVKEL